MTAPAYILDLLFSEGKDVTMENVRDAMKRSFTIETFGSLREKVAPIFTRKFGKDCVGVTFKTVEECDVAKLAILAEMGLA